ncbi:MAG: ArnT family glycosyltransferase [Paracoccaceae bacterium]
MAIAAIGGIVLFRIVLALFDRTELSTDEAQYWFWGQTFDFGAYSKPPLIGWIIRISTDMLGQSVAAVRLPAVLFHAATALVLFAFTLRIASAKVALLAALSYLTTPAVALGSAVMTTDTPMLFAAAVAMVGQVGLAQARREGRPATGIAVALGLALGLGLLAKQAMLFWLVGAIAAAILSPKFRLRAADAAVSGAVMLVVVSPYLWWLARHDFVTLHHVQDITRGGTLSALRPLLFLAEQFVVMGPVLFAAMLLAVGGRVHSEWRSGLVALAMAPLLITLAQGVKGPVLANWAVLYLIPGSVLAALWLTRYPGLAKLSLFLGLAVTLALPAVKVFGTGLVGPNGKPLLARYLGHADTAQWALETAQAAGAGTLIAQERSLLADLSWFGAGSGLTIRTVPPTGRPSHHWELTAPFTPETDPGPAVLLWPGGQPAACAQARSIGSHEASPGPFGGRTFVLLHLDAQDCLSNKDTAR